VQTWKRKTTQAYGSCVLTGHTKEPPQLKPYNEYNSNRPWNNYRHEQIKKLKMKVFYFGEGKGVRCKVA
jgi:hypothetical protein